MQIELDESSSNILIGSFLCDIPPGKFRENVFKNTLKANGQIPQTGVFAFNEPNAKLALFKYIPLEKEPVATLRGTIEHFIDQAMQWKEAIEAGRSAPLSFERDMEQAKPSLFSSRL